jgi:hypothetical protein
MFTPTAAGSAAAALTLAVVLSGRGQGSADAARAACTARAATATAAAFVNAFNAGDSAKLRRLIASRGFRGYVVEGDPGARVGAAARDRASLIRYFSTRHDAAEQLALTRFAATRRIGRIVSFEFDVVRSATDLQPPILDRGTGSVRCGRPSQLLRWSMKPNSEPALPTPTTYAETCKLVSTWCQIDPTDGGVPDALRRLLAFPEVRAGADCPSTNSRPFDNGQFVGLAFGDGPVQPVIAGAFVKPSGLVFRAFDPSGWYVAKTGWIASPDYEGPILIRGRQLDGPHKVALGGAPALVDPQLGPGPTLNGTGGWREWPGGTWLRTPGCYAWQIDGTSFSRIVIFKATFASS